jgi:hypothetical protein
MQTDLFHVIPTDYVVNGARGDLPYGIAGTVSQTFRNGGKIGTNVAPGAPSGSCYEPLDSFKGDLARTYFYMSTCYMNDSARFGGWEIAYNSTLKPWAIQMLLTWHRNDPVSRKELDRNNAAYALQRNRNPFIDHPEYADCIWGSGPCITAVNELEGTVSAPLVWYSNSTHAICFVTGANSNINRAVLIDYTGRKMELVAEANGQGSYQAKTNALSPGIYLVTLADNNGVYTQKIVVTQ